MNKNTKFTAVLVVSVVVGMIGLSYAAVPLYDLFCRTTGFGGTPVALKEEAIKLGYVTESEYDQWVIPSEMTGAMK